MNTTPSKENTEPKEKQPGIQLPAELDLRDYFAAKAMHGELASTSDVLDIYQLAIRAYQIADAMITARSNHHEP